MQGSLRYGVAFGCALAFVLLGCEQKAPESQGKKTTAPAPASSPRVEADTATTVEADAGQEPASKDPKPTVVQTGQDEGLEALIPELLKEWNVPGTAVIVFDSDKQLFGQGFGVRNATSKEPFNLDTIFPIESVSKTMTAVAIGILVDQGKVAWDDPVIKHVPDFKVDDPYATKHITLRDLLAHRSGLAAHAIDPYIMPLFAEGKACSKKGLLEFGRGLKPAHGLRVTDAYSNLGYVWLSEVIARVSGQTWADFLRQELFTPLGMASTGVGGEGYLKNPNHSLPHELDPEGVVAPAHVDMLPVLLGECLDGTGGVYTTANDLMRFTQMLMNQGQHGATRILKPETAQELWTPQNTKRVGPFLKETYRADLAAEAMGWEVFQYKGTTLVRQGGSGPGLQSLLFVLPREDRAVVIFQNYAPGLFHVTAAHILLDRLIKAPATDWLSRYRKFIPPIPERKEAPLPADKLEGYAGIFEAQGWPRQITVEDGKLYLTGTSPPGAGPPMAGRARMFGLDGEADAVFIKTSDAVFRFKRDETGAVTGFVETYGGVPQLTYTRK